ncbi:CPBP family intramembrane metalloprotease [Providencia rettgeri]|uniref:CPBP family glutamic-type intramembrane protease n=2 Tax=Providencia TaxID=586 RepID=UPI001CFE09E6|nr:CPBP family intramembrane glutamic endopeptidase [Providencia rettgeri]EIU7556863.1 CPBP family intramembrane metalloprotease [Providencia rettgeri]MCB4839240.1 CPBP family intramembrane metalloprotease [Providencia rettgeri]HEM8305112.1 CPBP family intramembrane metalloprotease [Providencia rettgeri]
MSLTDITTRIKEKNGLKIFLAISLIFIWFSLDYDFSRYYLVYIVEPLHLESSFILIYRLISLSLFILLYLVFQWYSKNIDKIALGRVFSTKSIIPFILTILLSALVIAYFKLGDDMATRELIIFDDGVINNILLFAITFIISPIVYEVIFRGIVFNAIQNKNKTIIWLFSVIPFVIFHIYTMANVFSPSIWMRIMIYQYDVSIMLIFLSCILTFARMRSDGVLLPIILNSFFFMSYIKMM